jgi:hypothetical protein
MKAAQSFDPRVDAYINKSAAFAQPIPLLRKEGDKVK